jgi:single-stranded-DNA-specific exonuclease
LDKLPLADIIVDPKQKGDEYPFKDLCATAVIFKVALILLEGKISEALRKSFLELVALATMADMMPQREENKDFIEDGLLTIENSFRPGLRVFFKTKTIKDLLNLKEKLSKIISILNVRDIDKDVPASFRLLTSSDEKKAGNIIKKLLIKSEKRKEKIKEMLEIIEGKIMEDKNPIIFRGEESFDLDLLSTVASILARNHKKPVFLFKKMEKESHGTVRSLQGIDSVELMKKCSSLLLTYGGHPPASGFRLKNENLEKFKECLIKNLPEISQ